MATLTIEKPDFFPDGTVLGAYPFSNWPSDDPPSGPPRGAAAEQATVSEGAATFSELAPETVYWIVGKVGPEYRYVGVVTAEDDVVDGPRDEPEGALKKLLSVLARKRIITDKTTAS